ncbi:hypothetical protein NC661_16740 [Aquibacillus koreensis]|uniref:Uncharacterized protein n=1 Tax=Aquibacillus koreensis TaxID=279446 RepID=A0A9X4AL22_9BACI|nr:hypothetical protein [Aquibacillus koreensis]MCT2536216.1 hypothetical protein [Aquibacillus koreensis]MDC3422020.1 hypothetical protein [Aquibacillus koreensis]
MYKLFLYSSVFTLIYFIIWVGVESIHIKVILGIVGLTFLPRVRKNLYKTPLVIRKSKVALYTSLFFTFLLFILDIKALMTEPNMDFTVIILIFLYSFLGSFIYGIPVSLFSDLITANVKKYRFYLSFLVHIGFGLLSFFFLGPLMIIATFIALLFFLIDEFLRKRDYIPFEI